MANLDDRAPVGADVAARQSVRAIDIETLLVWVYRDQKAHLHNGATLGPGPAADGCARVGEVMTLGTRVSSGAHLARFSECPVDPDAELVCELVRQLDCRRLVEMHAINGTRPDWRPRPAFRLEGVVNGQGKRRPEETPFDMWMHGKPATWPDAVRRSPRGRMWCPLVAVDRPEVVATARHEYRLWYLALATLAETLRRQVMLACFAVTGPAARAVPWSEIKS